jgi:peptidoglycan/xylan/chitin deacetylase (PgdA/CDA1 family)
LSVEPNPPKLRVAVTIDMEHDCPPYLSSWCGMEAGAPLFLDLLHQESVPATFFTTGDVARRYPSVLERIVAAGHELGCHGDTHRRFSAMTPTEARAEIATASEVLRRLAPVTSFRAPNLDFPEPYLDLLVEHGYAVDSSAAAYKVRKGHPRRPVIAHGIVRLPASTMPSVIRLPGLLRQFALRLQADPVVLFFHPWEFVDMTREPIPLDCRFRTGAPALAALRSAIHDLRKRGAEFMTMDRLADGYRAPDPTHPGNQ